MNKLDLILVFIIVALLIAAFSPEVVSPVQAAAVDQAALPQGEGISSSEQGAALTSPAAQIAIALICLLFGALTFFPLFIQNNGKHANQRGMK